MTDNEKKQMIAELSAITIRGLASCRRIYHKLYYSNLDTFQPDYSNEIDKKLANTVFARFILCLFSDPQSSALYSANHFYALSELKFKIDKLYPKISNIVSIDMIPDISKQRMYIKTLVADKTKYFAYNGDYFWEIKQTEFDTNKAALEVTDSNSIRFLPLTEME